MTPVPEVEAGVFPETADGRPWILWAYEEAEGDAKPRKIPSTLYANPEWPEQHVSAQNPENWTDREDVMDWAGISDDFWPAVNICDRDELPNEDLVLVDFDDAGDPETGEIHPAVDEYVGRAESYADVSTSGTGIHILARGSLPDRVTAVEGDLPAIAGFEDAEVYDSARYICMSGDHIAETPREINERQALVDELVDEYGDDPEDEAFWGSVDALDDLALDGGVRTREVATHPDVEVGEREVPRPPDHPRRAWRPRRDGRGARLRPGG
jgi:primase-polymerase (primpol)-like protein